EGRSEPLDHHHHAERATAISVEPRLVDHVAALGSAAYYHRAAVSVKQDPCAFEPNPGLSSEDFVPGCCAGYFATDPRTPSTGASSSERAMGTRAASSPATPKCSSAPRFVSGAWGGHRGPTPATFIATQSSCPSHPRHSISSSPRICLSTFPTSRARSHK